MSNQLEFRHFKYFLAVAEDLHFRKAAERLFISQPGLSRQIKQMEDELKIKLFKRHNRKVELTEAGKYLKEELKNNFKRLDKVINHTKLLHDGFEGNLKIGYVGSAMQKIIPDLLNEFRRKHPKVLFSLKEMDNNKQIQALLNKDIDIGFVRIKHVPKGINILPILKETFSLVLPKYHHINKFNFKDISQLKDEPVILFESSYSESYYESVMEMYEQCNCSPILTHYSVNASSIFRLVEKNFGISIVPTSLKLGYDMDIKFIELKNIPQRTTLRAVWHEYNINPILENITKLL